MGTYLAVDLGATSGRVIAGRLHDGRLTTREVHRFENQPLDAGHWDAERLFEETLTGLAAACADGTAPDGIAVSTWGVDVGLVDADGRLLAPPEHYRAASAAAQERLQAAVPPLTLFRRSGVQPSVINTVFRLGDAARRAQPPPGTTALLMPDLWTFRLCGSRGAERTIAGTTGLLAAAGGDWDRELAAAAGIDAALLPAVAEPGTRAGRLRPELAARIGVDGEVPVFRVAGHDTASAVAAIPGAGHVAFVSCGTWALAGIEHDAAVLDDGAFRAGFTNEIGFGGRTRLMRNLTGLWLLEEALRSWRAQGLAVTLAEVLQGAEDHGPVDALIDVGAPEFIAPGDVLARVADACRRDGYAVPTTPAQFTRCILQSLASAYRDTIEQAIELTGRTVPAIHVVGGGSRNGLLCQLTADACGLPVLAGPAEATSIGNLLVQAVAAGELASLDDVREVVRRSEPVERYEPRPLTSTEGDRVR
jgi:rhamnulokinase